MKKLLLSLSLLLASVFVYSQITFERHYDCTGYNGGTGVLQTDDGGYLIATQYLYLIKTNSYGDTLWTKSLIDNLANAIYSIKKTNDNCFIVCGTTHGYGLYGYNYWLVKLNSNGDTLWQKGYGGNWDEDACDVIPTSDGGYAIIGSSMSFGPLVSAYFVKTNNLGDTLWTKALSKNNETTYGSSLLQLDDNGYIIVGTTYNPTKDIYLARLNQFGDTLWTKTIGGAGIDVGGSIQKTNDNGFIIFGYTTSFGAGQEDVYVVKTNASGNVQWTKTYGSPDIEEGFRGIICSDGGFAISGLKGDRNANTSNSYLIRTNSVGDTLWTRTFVNNQNDWFGPLQQTTDGGFILSGYITIGDDYNVYLVKTNANGQVLGIDDYSSSMNNGITVYPNPTTGQVNIQISQQFGQTKTLEVYDCFGQKQFEKTNDFSDIDISSLTCGLYFIVVTNTDNERQTLKIIKD